MLNQFFKLIIMNKKIKIKNFLLILLLLEFLKLQNDFLDYFILFISETIFYYSWVWNFR